MAETVTRRGNDPEKDAPKGGKLVRIWPVPGGNPVGGGGPLALDFSGTTAVQGSLEVQNVGALVSTTLGFTSLATVQGNLTLRNVAALSNLDGFAKLRRVEGGFVAESNPDLGTCEPTNLAGGIQVDGTTSISGNQVDACG